MDLSKFLSLKSEQKDVIDGLDHKQYDVNSTKEILFSKDKDIIYIGGKAISIADLYLRRIPLDDHILTAVLNEATLLVNKKEQLLKQKRDFLNSLKSKSSKLENMINDAIGNRDTSLDDVTRVVQGDYENIIGYKILDSHNMTKINSEFAFKHGESKFLEPSEIFLTETISNKRMEMKFNKGYFVNFLVFNNILKTTDTYTIHVMDGESRVKVISNLDLSQENLVEIEESSDRIIVEGLGAREVVAKIQVCAGKKKMDALNKAFCLIECDLTKVKVPENFYLNIHEDARIFLWNKNEVGTIVDTDYQTYKSKFYDMDKMLELKVSHNIKSLDNSYLAIFIESEHKKIEELKIFGMEGTDE